MGRKIIIDEKNAFIIRETVGEGKARSVLYYMAPAVWTRNPMDATMFKDYDVGQAHLVMFRQRDWAPRANGKTAIYEVVGLYNETALSPNATVVNVKKIGKK